MPELPLSSARAHVYYESLHQQAVLERPSVKEVALHCRQCLERLLEEVTEPFTYRVDFDGAYSRLVFVQQEFALPPELAAKVHQARKQMNQVVHGRLPEELFNRNLPLVALADFVAALSGEAIPIDLAKRLPQLKTSKAERIRRAETTGWIRFVVTRLPEANPDEPDRLVLEGFAETGYPEPERPLSLVLHRHRNAKVPDEVLRDFTYLAALTWPYARLNINKLREPADAPGVLHTQLESELVLDPDFLVDASDLAGCFGQNYAQPLAFFIKKLVPQPPKGSLFKGSIVNDLLDGYLQDPALDFKQAFGQVAKDNFLKTACLGRQDLQEIYASIQADHLENLKAFAAHYADKRVATEPSYISPRYGLAGRMDMVVHDPDQEPTRWEVVELKSGNAPRTGTWHEHAAQATVYNMLLDSVAEERGYAGRSGTTEVFYSKADKRGRVVAANPTLREGILRVRNYIVSVLRQLRRGNMQALDVLGEQQENLAKDLRFDRENLLAFEHHYLKGDPIVKAYYQTWLAFLLREFGSAKTGEALADPALRDHSAHGYAGLWRDGLPKKRARFEALEPLTFEDISAEGLVRFAYTPADDTHCCLRAGDIIVLYPFVLKEVSDDQPEQLLVPAAFQLAKGTLVGLESGYATVQLRSRVLGHAYFARHAQWVAEPDQMDSSHWHGLSSLFNFLQADDYRPGLQALLLGKQGPALPSPQKVRFGPGCRLLPSQQAVVAAAVEAQDYFLLQGPPGTGKTSTALPEIIRQELARGRRNITVLCYTNRALDEVQTQLELLQAQDGIPYLSLKRKARTEQELDSLLAGRAFKLEAVAEAVGKVQIFLCTISSFLSNVHYLRQLCGSLDLLIVDEASMATEGQLVGLLPFFNKFILVGDENQLPPVVVQSAGYCQIAQDSPLYGLGFRDLRHSLFERLLALCRTHGWAHAYGMLTDHFRMHPLIADLVNPYYGNQLLAQASYAESLKLEGAGHHPAAQLLAKGNTLFFETGPAITAKLHDGEAELTASLVAALIDAQPGLSIGVLSPWRAQNRRIVQALEALGIDTGQGEHGVKVDTIERYQGAERDVIILSTALAESRYLAAMQSPIPREGLPAPYKAVDRKLVVALSRARQLVVVLGHAPFLSSDPHYGAVVEVIKRRQGFVSRQEREGLLQNLQPA